MPVIPHGLKKAIIAQEGVVERRPNWTQARQKLDDLRAEAVRWKDERKAKRRRRLNQVHVIQWLL